MGRIDPLAKILGLFILLSSLFFIHHPLEIIISSGFILLFILLVSLRETLIWLKRGLFFIVPILIFNTLFREDGLMVGLLLSYKLFLAIILASLFSKYTPIQELIVGISKILKFFHIPERKLSQSLSFTLFFIPHLFKRFKHPRDLFSLPTSIVNSLNEVEKIEPILNKEPMPLDGKFWILIPSSIFLLFTILYP